MVPAYVVAAAALSMAAGPPSAPLTMHHIDSCTQCGRPAKGQPGSWCQLPPVCTRFAFDAVHVQGPPLSSIGCGALACDATTYCTTTNGNRYDLFAATNASVPPPAKPCPAPPAPPAPPPPLPRLKPVYHLPARCEEGDVNSFFQYEGNWHLMQQWHARPHTSIGHSVSSDLLHFHATADALASGSSADEQCYDGSSSLVELSNGTLSPLLMIDGGTCS